VLSLIIGPSVFAEPVDQATAEGRAAQFVQRKHSEWRGHVLRGRSRIPSYAKAAGLREAAPTKRNTAPLRDPDTGKVLGYVTQLQPVGYVVTSSDTDLSPVIAFSLDSSFSFQECKENLLLYIVRYDLKERHAARTRTGNAELMRNRTQWTSLAGASDEGGGDGGPDAAPAAGQQIWGPWMDTQWSQGYPYNMYCPIDPITGDRCATGCAATASAQVANYWMWPHSIDFLGGPPGSPGATDSYISERTPPLPPNAPPRIIPIDADTADIPQMIYTGNPSDPNHPTDDMIGRLMYAMGVATQMSYSSSGSAGGCGLGHPRVGYRNSTAALDDDLKNGRVAWCGVADIVTPPEFGPEGHAIVCDGIWESSNPALQPTMYHLNFGWAGSTDGWYVNTNCTEGGMPRPWSAFGGSVLLPPAPVIATVADANVPEGIAWTSGVPEITLATRSRPCTWSFVNPSDPNVAGMTIDSTNGVIRWANPSPIGSVRIVSLRAHNEAGDGETTFRLTVVAAPPVIAEIPDANWAAGVAYTGPTPTLSQGSPPITWSLDSGPTGMTIDPGTGVVSWPAPTSQGSPFTVTIRAENSAGSDTESWQLAVKEPPTIADIANQTIKAGVAYTVTPSVNSASLPVVWSLVGGPAGLTIDPNTGVVTWPNPQSPGTQHAVEIKAKNIVAEDTETWTLTIALPPVIADIPDGQVAASQAYTGPTPTLTQGTEPVTWSFADPIAVPAGMTIDPSTGVVSWPNPRPSRSVIPITIKAENVGGFDTELWNLTITLPPGAPIIEDIPDANIPFNQAYTGPTPALTQGIEPIVWSFEDANAVPSGMTIDPNTGVVSWPNPSPAGGTVVVTIRAENSGDHQFDTESWTLRIAQAPPVIADIPDATIPTGTPYVGPTPSATGTMPFEWSVVSGPSGMTIDANGVVTWPDPSPAGQVNVTIKARNGSGEDTESWKLTLVDPPVIAEIPDANGVAGTAYTGPTPTLVQGTLPVTWSLSAGPSGMSINTGTGVVQWPNPTTTGSPFTVTIKATNGPNIFDEESWLLTIDPAPVAPQITYPSPNEVFQAVEGTAFDGPEPNATGTPPIVWSLAAGPATMTIDAAGVVHWPEPNIAGSPRQVIIRATNPAGPDQAAEVAFYVAVSPRPTAPNITPIGDANIPSGTPYTGPTPVATGTQPITWMLLQGPLGMEMPDPNTGVVFWPNPTSAGSPFTVTIRATNAVGTADESWQLTVTDPPVAPVIAPIADANAIEGQAYTGPTPSVTGTQPFTWWLVAGPTGMTISSTGVVHWPNPVVSSVPYTITIRATNAAGKGDRSWRLTVQKPTLPPVIAPMANAQVTAGQTYTSVTPTLTQGTLPVTWSLVSGPPGMTIAPTTGVVTWANASNPGSQHAISIRATNAAGSSDASWVLSVLVAKVTISVGVSPANVGLVVTVDGQNYTTVQSFDWEPASMHQIAVATPQTDTGGATYVFDSWSDGNKSAGRTVTVGSAMTYTATFQKVTPVGLTIIGSSTLEEGQSTQCLAQVTMSDGTIKDGTSQASWWLSTQAFASVTAGKVTAGQVNSDSYCEVYASYTQDGKSLTARLPMTIVNKLPTFTLTVSTLPAGAGSPVRSDHNQGAVVALSVPAPPEEGMVFTGWGGDASGTADPLYVTMDANKDVVAVFSRSGDLPAGLCGTQAGLTILGFALLVSGLVRGVGSTRKNGRR